MGKEILTTSLNSGTVLMDQVILRTHELNGNLFTTDGSVREILKTC